MSMNTLRAIFELSIHGTPTPWIDILQNMNKWRSSTWLRYEKKRNQKHYAILLSISTCFLYTWFSYIIYVCPT
ncbi:hypothetical protein PGT21_006132 [Puccinia graminis f. sp. tritici]|uniref:Uncharacterized protein n=1 Tax=Puccinia graminis f. sp. tritici TaxID=56615 RepID=A0A5B0QEQ7_PUCGR|nr:hypothetical protein PGT21_006132 [Puccinia graminis f. sp. tritici]